MEDRKKQSDRRKEGKGFTYGSRNVTENESGQNQRRMMVCKSRGFRMGQKKSEPAGKDFGKEFRPGGLLLRLS